MTTSRLLNIAYTTVDPLARCAAAVTHQNNEIQPTSIESVNYTIKFNIITLFKEKSPL